MNAGICLEISEIKFFTLSLNFSISSDKSSSPLIMELTKSPNEFPASKALFPISLSIGAKDSLISFATSPILVCVSSRVADNCAILPASVCPKASFIPPTDEVITSVKTAHRSSSVPYFKIFSCASSNL